VVVLPCRFILQSRKDAAAPVYHEFMTPCELLNSMTFVAFTDSYFSLSSIDAVMYSTYIGEVVIISLHTRGTVLLKWTLLSTGTWVYPSTYTRMESRLPLS